MNSGVEEIEQGNRLIGTSEEMFDSIFSRISTLNKEMNDISAATNKLISQTEEVIYLFDDISTSNELNTKNIAVVSGASSDQYRSVEGLDEAISSLNTVSNQLNDLLTQIQ